jgi:hypothetical protein
MQLRRRIGSDEIHATVAVDVNRGDTENRRARRKTERRLRSGEPDEQAVPRSFRDTHDVADTVVIEIGVEIVGRRARGQRGHEERHGERR